jgi:membrane-associated phospholipid phosphatase
MSVRVFPSPGLWIGLGVIALIDLLALAIGGFRIVGYRATLVILAVCAAAAALGYLYSAIRPDERLAALCWGASYLITYTLVASILNYLGTSLNFPLLDAQFARADAAVGFDWMAVLTLSDRYYAVGRLLRAIYFTSLFQIIAVFLILAATRQTERLAGFLTLFTATGLATIVLSCVFPAAGAFVYHNPPEALRDAVGYDAGLWHLHHFEALRSGAMRVINPAAVEGLVTFPSFHAALAAITAWAFWQTRFVAYPTLALNIAVTLTAIPVGGHYFVDIVAGLAIAAISIAAVEKQRIGRTTLDPMTKMSGSVIPHEPAQAS